MTAADLIAESNAFPVGSPDWNYRRRAAWQLDQMARKVPARDWTETPPHGLTTAQERLQ